jgi:hypothetical protein
MDDAERSQTETMIIASEGRRRKLYFDSLGHPSVGIGFNLERSDAPTLLQKLGADWVAIMDGKAELTDEQIDTLFRWCFDEALAYAQKLFPNWEDLIPEARMVLTDMSFQLHARLLGFVKMRDAVAHEDYGRMVSEMRQSLYAKQVPTRCARNAAVIEAGLAKPKPKAAPPQDDGGFS